MANPSSVYVEDESARQTLANGTVLKWTKQLQNIHALNGETDLSIAYTNWANEPMMTRANRGFHRWQGGCVSGGDLGTNQSEGFGYQHATGIKQLESGQPRIDSLQSHVVLSNGGGYYVWGYNPESSSRISGGNGDQRRYLLDMDINKMLFNCTITVVDKSFFDNVDYTSNPENMPAPSEHSITLKELYTHPELYYCTGSISWGNTYVYGEDTSDHWRGAAIRPSIILTGESIGEFQGADDSIFGRFNANGSFSYDSRDPNGHASFGGGGSSNTLYNRMNSGYFMGCKNEIDMTPTDTFDSAGGASTAIALGKWGNTNFNKFAYCNGQIFDYGDSVIWCAWGCRVVNNTDTGSIYRDYTFGTRRYIKADKMLKYIASFGLYFMSESFDPDTVSLTPETLGDDSRIMLGEMSADGTTTGRWITDIDSYHGPNKDGKTSNPDYDPSGGSGGDDDQDSDWDDIAINGAGIGGGSAFCRFYYCTEAELAKLRTWTMGLSEHGDTIPGGFDPKSNIIGLTVFPFTISGDGPTTIKFTTNGGQDPVTQQQMPRVVDSGVSCEGGAGATTRILNATIDVPATMKNRGEPWLDYESYIELFIPMCGVYQVDPQVVIGRTIHVEIFLDPVSGTVMGIAWVPKENGKCVIAQGSGTPGVQIPVAVGNYGLAQAARVQNTLGGFGNTASSALSNQIISNAYGVPGQVIPKMSDGKITIGLDTGTKGRIGSFNNAGRSSALGYSGLISSVQHWVSARQIANSPGTSASGGFSGSMAEWCGVFTPYVKIVRPKFRKPANYKHTCGEPEVTTRTLNSVGYAICINPDVSGLTNATDSERMAIYQFLSTGVYYK